MYFVVRYIPGTVVKDSTHIPYWSTPVLPNLVVRTFKQRTVDRGIHTHMGVPAYVFLIKICGPLKRIYISTVYTFNCMISNKMLVPGTVPGTLYIVLVYNCTAPSMVVLPGTGVPWYLAIVRISTRVE